MNLESLKSENLKLKQDVEALKSKFKFLNSKIYLIDPATKEITFHNDENLTDCKNIKCYEYFSKKGNHCSENDDDCIIEKFSKMNKPIKLDATQKNKHNLPINKECIFTPLHDENGNLSEILLEINNWDDSTIYIQCLEDNEAKYKAVLEQSADNIYLMDLETCKVIEANQSLCNLLGYSEEELRQMQVFEFLNHPKNDVMKNIEKLKKIDRIFLSQRQYKTKFGEIRDVEVNSSIIKYRGKSIVCVVSRDITNRIKIEQSLKNMKKNLEDANKVKSVIISNVSHELRTPLNSILGFTKILKNELPQTDYQDMLDHIEKSGERLNKTISSLLTLSELESDDFQLDYQDIRLVDIVKSSTMIFEEYTRNKNLFIMESINDYRIYVRADEHLLFQILYHLIDNSFKYTMKGYIKIEIDSLEVNDELKAVIRIKDTGSGIPENQLSKVFDAFRQGSEGIDRNYSGIGIGLTITKKMVELLDGKIEVESSPKIGSIFSVFFPGFYKA